MVVAIDGQTLELPSLHCSDFSPKVLDNVNAAVLDVKLNRLEEWIAHRQKTAALYKEGLAAIPQLRLPHFDEFHQRDVFQNYVIRAQNRDALRQHLQSCGVETLVHWPKPMWCHSALGLPNAGLQKTETLCCEVLSLPLNGEITEQHVAIVADSIRSFYASRGQLRRAAD